MSLAPLLKSAVKAPVLAVAGVVLGLLFCVLLVLANLNTCPLPQNKFLD